MRLNHFLPLQSQTRHRVLRLLGPSWAAAPARRVIQALCFLTFLALLFWTCWPYTAQPSPVAEVQVADGSNVPAHHALDFASKELLPAELFLALDPLTSISAALAARTWIWSLSSAAIILALAVLLPRSFCGYICPFGTLIDLFDWAVGQRISRFNLQRDGWWVRLKYYVLCAVLVAAACGLLLSSFVAAIPVLTRGLVFVLAPLQMGLLRGWHQAPPLNAGHFVSIALFLAVFALSFLRPRFWCRHVCPSGAVLSCVSLLRVHERTVETHCSKCGKCGKCVQVCPFDAIGSDFATRSRDCAFCQTCGGTCPAGAISFGRRRNAHAASEFPVTRRGFLSASLSSAAIVAVARYGANQAQCPPVRPPGSVPEADFLRMCVACGECFKACPNNVLQPIGFQRGIEAVWTPEVVADWSGCEPSCNNCGQVCPTSAIRALPLPEKRAARMALAVIDETTCLPLAGMEACQMCVDECRAAGYNALEFIRVGVETDEAGAPIEGTGFTAPVVVPEKCVGCGLCQTRCYHINVETKAKLRRSAICIEAGAGKEDRILSGSYIELRRCEAEQRAEERKRFLEKSGVKDPDAYVP